MTPYDMELLISRMAKVLGTVAYHPHFASVQDMAPARELPIALAHSMVKVRPGSKRMELLNRVYCSMDLVAQIQCRAELSRCRRAISEQQRAEIS